jgi:hypothetical protein
MHYGYQFAATNYQLSSPFKTDETKLLCGEPSYLCARTSTGEEYILIDWYVYHILIPRCDPAGAERCTVSDPGHLDILVIKESNNVDCTEGCESFTRFTKSGPWDLVKCSFEINASDFPKVAPVGDGSEYGW